MNNITYFSTKQKIILKIYIKYIVKKIFTKSSFNKNISHSFRGNEILITNKFLLESILNKKYIDQDNYIEFKNYLI
jgi:hypothetical protein